MGEEFREAFGAFRDEHTAMHRGHPPDPTGDEVMDLAFALVAEVRAKRHAVGEAATSATETTPARYVGTGAEHYTLTP